MSSAEQVLVVGGVVIWVVSTVTDRVRRRVDPQARSVTGPALVTLWAAFFGSRYGVVALVDHSAAFRVQFGDAAAAYRDVQDATGPWVVVSALVTLASRLRGVLIPGSGRNGCAAAGQVPVVDRPEVSSGR